jgi:3-oxoacyl-[acyl-carrier-protein] synthase-3
MDVYVDSFAAELGEISASVEESEAADRLLSKAAALRQAGFDRHHLAAPNTTVYDLAWRAVQQVDDDRLHRVDAIIWGSCIPQNANLSPTTRFDVSRDVKHLMDHPASRLHADLGLVDSPIFGLTQQGCTNVLGAVRLARALLLSEPTWEHILCVSSDRFPPSARYEQAYNLISDGAVCCLVSKHASGYRYISAHHATNGAMVDADDDETVGAYFSRTRLVVNQALTNGGLKADDVRWVIPQNTDWRAWQLLPRMIGFDREGVAMDTVADAGHVISADNVLNLLAVERSGRVAARDVLVLVTAGYGMNWSCLVLERV